MGVNLLFTVDIDNDGVENNERTALTWKSVSRIPRIKEIFDSFNLRLTWFVRADNQLMDVYGTAAYLLLEHGQLWAQMESSGDEIGWHPHLYEWDAEQQLYVCERDETGCVEKLRAIRAELKTKGFNHSSVRIGEAFHCNATMKVLDEMGLEVDSTAIPGRMRHDEARVFDWERTPNEPYHPSAADYRVPGTSDRLNILEVPMTTIPVKASYDADFIRRYINPSFHHANFKEGLDRHLDARTAHAADGEEFLTVILHSDEVSAEERAHPLYSFSFDVVRRNVAYLLETLEARGLEYRSLRMKDVLPKMAQATSG